MLYHTHQKFGLLSGIVGIPLTIGVGVIPKINDGLEWTSLILVLLSIYIAIRGALFGAEFPDCDSYGGVVKDEDGRPKLDEFGQIKKTKGSIPAQKHPLIAKVFKFFGVKHRGLFSHDYLTQTGLWIGVYLLVKLIEISMLPLVTNGSMILGTLFTILLLFVVWNISLDSVDLFNISQDVLNGKRKQVKHNETWDIDSKRLVKGSILAVILLLLISIPSIISLNIFSASQGIFAYTTFFAFIKIYIIFTLVGVYSHLFADMITKSGVSIGGYKLQPTKVLLTVRKIPFIGKFLVPTEFKADSKYNDVCGLVALTLCVPSSLIGLQLLFN